MSLEQHGQHESRSKKLSSPGEILSDGRLFLSRELLITSRMLKSNTGASIVVWIVGVLARLIASSQSTLTTCAIIIESLVDAFIYAYIFDILNQVTSVQEDILNKPDRPIPAGLLTIEGAIIRLSLSWLGAYPIVNEVTGREAARLLLLWEFWSLFCYVWPRINHWFFRNSFAGIGVYIMYRWIDIIISNHVSGATIAPVWDALFAVWVFLTCHVQEFHDLEGDRKVGRRTLAVILSPNEIIKLRRFTAGFMVYSAVACLAWLRIKSYPQTTFVKLLITASLFLYVCIVIAIRVWVLRSKDYDEYTYKVYYILCSCLFSLFLRIAGSPY